MLEAAVIRATLRFTKARKIHAIRMHFGRGVTAGWPDYCFLIPGGRPLWVEFKSKGKKPTPLQVQKINLLRERGYDVEVCDSPESAIAAIRRALEAAQLSAPRN